MIILYKLTTRISFPKGHVQWETAMPANLGYMSAMLYNQNNCASESSPVTSKYEMEVGKDLCVMVGYDRDRCMGHLTAGGSVANIEAIWAGRNVKYFPLGLQEALLKDKRLSGAKSYKVRFPVLLTFWFIYPCTLPFALFRRNVDG